MEDLVIAEPWNTNWTWLRISRRASSMWRASPASQWSAAAHSDGYAATGHLLGLLAALPAPTAAGERFWSDLWRSSGTAYLLPVNIKDSVLRSLAGEGTGLARQILSAVDEMPPPQRFAAGEVIGQALVESDHLPDLKTQVIGELWLRDLELTAWRVLHADRRSDDPAGRKAFLDAWTSV
ncbi:hypothetical protein [Streptomyces sp. MA15]|uniref:hypothetical protein n=1 Tax=Streptomyces sp. MA15 TaxID=3055061 RepID=UPI0025B19774|nr:hypothetical protein [Streptomyces sp. MA15]MDN3268947.1 hypothetical protein [Streptomyces sp. MA15]